MRLEKAGPLHIDLVGNKEFIPFFFKYKFNGKSLEEFTQGPTLSSTFKHHSGYDVGKKL